jgi:TonB family protein
LALLAGAAEARRERDPSYERLQIIQNLVIQFPSHISLSAVDEGEARILIWVDEEGKLRDWMVTGYSHPLFAKETLDVLPSWKFVPAKLHGRPVRARTEILLHFKREGVVRLVSGEEGIARKFAKRRVGGDFHQRVCELEELDAEPDALVEVTPEPPDKLGAVVPEGKVVVDYYIDADGRVRMPLIVSSDDDAFSQSVLLAITEWRYAPPKKEGVPVITRVWRQFDFRPIRQAGTE